ncbi:MULTISPECIES: EF-hand domain-containing protein [Halomonas]|uniref:EF hand domain-containing protein n=1 Tax=Halomonas ventosae TaxID=229007 RepID=A0A4R6I2C6_9GAMM|nr:EF-hand domain-containing protein [Halomonas ventosae]TDO15291.1 EF hand domain-containing protein [Halomonas ventosae]
MYKGKLLIGATVLTVIVASVANASPDRYEGHGMPTMSGMTPDDLPMSVQELKARQADRFSEADANGDGQLDVREMQALLIRMRAERRIQRLDSNGDGSVSQDEFAYPVERRLMRMDRNGDGRIERNEIGRGWYDDDRWGTYAEHGERRGHGERRDGDDR